MNTLDIKRILISSISLKYSSYVLACDELKSVSVSAQGFCIVVNKDTSHQPGSHWVAIFNENKSEVIEFFDSFAMP